jgi:hypothetical protein
MQRSAGPRTTAHVVDGCVARTELPPAKSAKTLIGGTTDQRVETEPNRRGRSRQFRQRKGRPCFLCSRHVREGPATLQFVRKVI